MRNPAALWLVQAAARLVPRGVRQEWLAEWDAEIRHRAEKLAAWGRWSPAGQAALAGRAAGAFADAAWLRWADLQHGVTGDLRLGVRLLAKHPGVTAVTIAALAIGIALNTSLFALLDAVLWQSPPVRDPASFAAIYTSDGSGPTYGMSSLPDFQDLAAATRSWESLAAFAEAAQAVEVAGETERLEVATVTARYFDTIGLTPFAGRLPAAESEVLLGYGLWQRRFGGSPGALGGRVSFGGRAYAVTGIAPRGFAGTTIEAQPQLWRVMAIPEDARRGNRAYQLIGRLRPGVTGSDAQSELDVLARRLAAAHPPEWTDRFGRGRRLTLVPGREARFDPDERPNVLRLGLFGLALTGLIQILLCANVAGVLLARGQTRRKEIAVRLALGAARLRLVRQLLAEAALLALAGGVSGLVLTWWVLPLLATVPELLGGAALGGIQLSLRGSLFASGLVLATALLAGLAPAAGLFRAALLPSLKDDAAALEFRCARSRWSGALVAGQFAASLVLLVVAAMLARSYVRTQSVATGFTPGAQSVVRAEVDPSRRTPESWRQWISASTVRLAAIPGVEAAALALRAPLADRFSRRSFIVEGYKYAPGEERQVHFLAVTPGYLAAMGIPLRAGRDFSAAEIERGAEGLIVNEAFARKYWPGEDPLLKTVRRMPGQPPVPVVGVTGNWKFLSPTQGDLPLVLAPLADNPAAAVVIHLRGRENVRRDELEQALPQARVFSVTSFDAVARSATAPARFSALALGGFAGLALALSAIGVFGVVAQTVAQSRREIAVRAALGATRGRLIRDVLAGGLKLLAAGVILGIPAAYAAARVAANWLFGVPALDPGSLAAGLVLLAIVALAAMWLPARRAAAVDPAHVLRYQ